MQLLPELQQSFAFTDKHFRGLLFKLYSPSIYFSEYLKNGIVSEVEDLQCISAQGGLVDLLPVSFSLPPNGCCFLDLILSMLGGRVGGEAVSP